MARNVWHKRYQGDALNGYMGLSLEQRGAYTTLLDLMYDTDWKIGIPDRERWLAGFLNVSVRKWNSLRKELIDAGKIDIIDGFISNFRYRKERENALETSRKRAENGASGGEKSGETRKKRSKNNETNEASASVLPLYARATETEAETETDINTPYGVSPALQPAHVVEAWNGMADRFKLPSVRGKLSDTRKRKVTARIKEHPLPDWLDALSAIERSAFLRGDNNSGWTASFDWMIEPRNFTKLIEGNYDRQL